jgi:MiaB/RimO family radical SAM methylthiotransferase
MISDKKIFVFTNGCPENYLDAQRIVNFFQNNNWILTKKYTEADLIILNICGQQLWNPLFKKYISLEKMIKKIKKKKKSSGKIIICGCITKINKNLTKRFADIFVEPDNFEKFNEIINANIKIEFIQANQTFNQKNNFFTEFLLNLKEFYENPLTKISEFYILFLLNINNNIEKYRHKNLKRYHIKISTGCLSNCSYCSIKFSRGNLKSKPIENIVQEFKEGINKGYNEFLLIGTDLGCYGRDLGKTLVDLLRSLIEIEGNYTIMLRNVNPQFLIEMLPDLKEIFKTGKISYIGSSVQSGNDRILNLMNRKYTVEEYKNAINTIKKVNPKIQIRSQFIVGFPSETNSEFRDTIKLIKEIQLDFIKIYDFKPEAVTIASKMTNQIPKNVIKKRHRALYKKYYIRK